MTGGASDYNLDKCKLGLISENIINGSPSLHFHGKSTSINGNRFPQAHTFPLVNSFSTCKSLWFGEKKGIMLLLVYRAWVMILNAKVNFTEFLPRLS